MYARKHIHSHNNISRTSPRVENYGIEGIIERLKAYKEGIKDEESNVESQGKLQYANSHRQGFTTSQGRGRGKGGRGYRGWGRGRFNSQDTTTNQAGHSKDNKDISK